MVKLVITRDFESWISRPIRDTPTKLIYIMER